jgi:hypothetical protein
MSQEEEEALFLKRVPGGVDNLDDERRERARNAHDVQLERATDFLKAMLLVRDRSQYVKRTGSETRTTAARSGRD